MFKILISFMIALASSFAVANEVPESITLTSKNTIVLRGEVNSKSIGKVLYDINSSSEKELFLFISSPGGSIFAGNQLVQAIKSSDKKITCIANVAISMAFVILQACETRVSTPVSVTMQHVASYGVSGDSPNNVSMLKFIESMLKEMNEEQAKRIGLPYKKFQAKTRNDWWLYGSSIVKNNVTDGISKVVCSKELTETVIKDTVRVFIFSIKVEFSGCPLIEYPLKVEADEVKRNMHSMSPEERAEAVRVLKTLNLREYVLELQRNKSRGKGFIFN
jgi:ATP-dependent Clp protease protease subunit